MSVDFRPVQALMSWEDRMRVYEMIRGYPIPLLMAFVRVNRPLDWPPELANIGELPDDMAYALLAFCIKPSKTRVKWPKKKGKTNSAPYPFRPNEQHWELIVENDMDVRNEIRIKTPDQIPKGMTKKLEKKAEWL